MTASAPRRPPRTTHLSPGVRVYVVAPDTRAAAQLAGELGLPAGRGLPLDADHIYRALRGRTEVLVLVTPSAMAAMTVAVESELRRVGTERSITVRWPS